MNENIFKESRAVRLEIGEDEVLFVGVNTGSLPPNKATEYREKVKDAFKEVLPENIKIMVGPHDTEFVVVGKKSVFKEKLKGTVND